MFSSAPTECIPRFASTLLGTELRTTYIGQSAFRVNIPRLPEIDCIVLQGGESGMAGFVPIGPELAYLFYNAHLESHERIPDDQLASRLRDYLAPFGGLAARVRDEFVTDDADIVLRPEETMGVPTPWHKGRVVPENQSKQNRRGCCRRQRHDDRIDRYGLIEAVA